MPLPVSFTLTVTKSPSEREDKVIVPPSKLNFMALEIRLRIIVLSISISTKPTSSLSRFSRIIFTPFCAAIGIYISAVLSMILFMSVCCLYTCCLFKRFLAHFSRLSSKRKISSEVLFIIWIISYTSSPTRSLSTIIKMALFIIFNEPSGERRSWAITEYSVSLDSIVFSSSALMRLML